MADMSLRSLSAFVSVAIKHFTKSDGTKYEWLNYYVLCISVIFALVFRHAVEYFLRRIVSSSVVCLTVSYFSILSHKRNDFRIKVIKHEMCLEIICNFGLLRRIQQDINVCRSLCKVSIILVWF
jgi:hypothetical protein